MRYSNMEFCGKKWVTGHGLENLYFLLFYWFIVSILLININSGLIYLSKFYFLAYSL